MQLSGIYYQSAISRLVLFLFFFTPFLSLLVYNALGVKVLAAVPALLRDMLVLLFVVFGVIYKFFLDKRVHFTLLLFCLLLASISISILSVNLGVVGFDEFVSVIANNIRRFIFPFLIFYFFLFYFKYRDIDLLAKFILAFWLFGLFEWLMPLMFWEKMGLLEYWNEYSNSVSSTGGTHNQLQGYPRLFTFDTYYLIGQKSRRLISFYIEPTTTAALAQASVIFGLVFKRKAIVWLATIAGFLTYSKGFIIFFILLTPMLILYKYASLPLLKFYCNTIAFLLFGMLFAGFFIFLAYPQIVQFGLFAHLEGLYEFFIHFNILGYGIGNVGSFRFDSMWGGVFHRVGVESSLANLISQLGLMGFISVYGLFVFFLNRVITRKETVYVYFGVILYVFVYSTSNSSTGYSGNFLIYLLVVIVYKYFSLGSTDSKKGGVNG